VESLGSNECSFILGTEFIYTPFGNSKQWRQIVLSDWLHQLTFNVALVFEAEVGFTDFTELMGLQYIHIMNPIFNFNFYLDRLTLA
jgi:hypothetical protein